MFLSELQEKDDVNSSPHLGLVAVIRELEHRFTDPSPKLENLSSSDVELCLTTLAELVTSL